MPDLSLRLSEDEPENNGCWAVFAYNSRVQKSWEKMMVRVPDNLNRCLEDLCTQPMQRKLKRIFSLKGKPYKGAWEYKVTGGDRVYYVLKPETRQVIVYYADVHPNPPSPKPPKDL
jgi:hypothetical protein